MGQHSCKMQMSMQMQCILQLHQGYRVKTLTRVDLPVGGDTIGIDNALEAIGELVGVEVGGWFLFRLHHLDDAWHCAATHFLQSDNMHCFQTNRHCPSCNTEANEI